VTVARPAAGAPAPSAALDPSSVRPVTFAGARTARLVPGASVTGDPVRVRVPDGGVLVVSAYLPGPTGPISMRRYALATGYLSAPGDHTADPRPSSFPGTTTSFLLVTGVDVRNDDPRPGIAVLGDSITEGYRLPVDTDQRWTDVLARRLAHGGHLRAVANLGISANRLLLDHPAFGDSALTRFGRDVLALPGLGTVIVSIGGNDIFMQPHQLDPDRIVSGLRRLTVQGHRRGLRGIGTTLPPAAGWALGTEHEAVRRAVNGRIRSGRVFDAVADFDAALRDPSRPGHLLPAYDSGDGIHPNVSGAAALAAAIGPRMVWTDLAVATGPG
jgi:lysophospholipase L1-like esterase